MGSDPHDPPAIDDSFHDAQLRDLMAFLDGSPSPFHVVATASNRLTAAGFAGGDLSLESCAAPRGFCAREGALVAWSLPPNCAPGSGLRILGAHTDSPNLRVKANADHAMANWRQLNVEVYGGILNNSWLDRDLGLAGMVIDTDGRAHLVMVSEPVARIPQLAVHLDRSVNESGLILDRQQHLRPVWGTTEGLTLREWLSTQIGGATPTWWELGLYDIQPAALIGADRSLLASGRLDNQLSCWAGIDALIGATPLSSGAIVVLNDHEEVGSASTTGASGPLLEHVIELLTIARGGGRSEMIERLAGSMCISADNAHAVHPNYPERHDPAHRPLVGGGPAIKINANQRYATTAATASSFAAACTSAGVPWQVFTSHNAMPCGSTIGPLTATRLGIDTVDVGVPQLSMHSARELCGRKDPVYLAQALRSWMSA